MLSQYSASKVPVSRSFTGTVSTSRVQNGRATLCQAERRRYYRNGSGRFPDDVNQFMDVVTDVLAGAETIYAASKRARDEQTPFNADQNAWSSRRGSYADKNATSQTEKDIDADAIRQEAQEKAEQALRAIPVDVEELEDGYILYMDVPGLQKSDVKIQLFPSQRRITISGERVRTSKQETDGAGRSFRRRYERRMGKFSRTLTLAKDLDVKTVSAKVDHGVLTVTAKKLVPIEPEAMEISID